MSKRRREINKVFTPRLDVVNNEMYIKRQELELELYRKMNGSKHVIIYGDSGSGKSWLYKKVFKDSKIKFNIINLAHADRMGSITNIFKNEVVNKEEFYKKQYNDITEATAKPLVFEGKARHENIFTRREQDPIKEYINIVCKNNGIIVLDNLESIFDTKYMKELGDILILLDDSEYKIKFLIVGVPSGVIEYYSSKSLLKTVANRLDELKEVKGLNKEQVGEFLRKGFEEELLVTIPSTDFNFLKEHVFWITNGIPQRIHEYCEVLAYILEDHKWVYSNEYIKIADEKVLSSSLHTHYMIIKNMMNSIETNVGRRNQVLYCLGILNKTIFKAGDVENIMRSEFIKSTTEKGLNINLILNDLCGFKNSFIKKSERDFIITDNRFILCIRMMIVKTEDEKIATIEINELT